MIYKVWFEDESFTAIEEGGWNIKPLYWSEKQSSKVCGKGDWRASNVTRVWGWQLGEGVEDAEAFWKWKHSFCCSCKSWHFDTFQGASPHLNQSTPSINNYNIVSIQL